MDLQTASSGICRPASYEFNKNAIKDGIIKNGIIYGPNGSGKTNFSLALFDIENHLSPKWKKIDYYVNFVYAGKKEGVVEFEYTFRFGSEAVVYAYSKNAGGILVSESLRVGKQIFCDINGSEILFSLVASTGTKSLQLLYFWMKRMSEASFVFIDEFDAFYHFRLAFEVCKVLFNMDCQIFTSSHNIYLMTNDLLRPDCNFILNDNKIKSLCDCTDKELRFGHNIEKLFRGNTFNV